MVRHHQSSAEAGNARSNRAAALIIGVYVIASFFSVAQLFIRPRRRGLSPVNFFFNWIGVPLSASFVTTVLLCLLTGALVRRKRAAWLVAVVLEIISAGWSALALLDLMPTRMSSLRPQYIVINEVIAIILPMVMLVVFWLARREFASRLSGGSWVKAIAVALAGFALAFCTTEMLVRRNRVPGISDRRVVFDAFDWALGLGDLALLPRHLRYVSEIAGVILAVSLILAVWVFMRSARRGHDWSEADELEVRQILARWGKQDSLGYFATRRDKTYIFSADRQAAIAYHQFGSVSLAAGDPLGNPDSWHDVIDRWIEQARTNGWVPAVISASEAGARAYAASDLAALAMGDESVIETDRFTLDRASMTPVRQSVTRARRAGVTVAIARQLDLSSAELAELRFWGNAWRHGDERGFSMTSSRLSDVSDPEAMVVRAYDEKGKICALLTFAPWGTSGLSLDAMRRAESSPNGTMELMVTELISYCSRRGISRISLNFAMLRGVFAGADKIGASPVNKLNSSMLTWLDRFFQLERLYRSNQKYDPTWVPRFLCFDGVSTLPYVLLACARAEGYLGKRLPPEPTLAAETLWDIRQLAEHPPALAVEPVKRSDQTSHRIRHAEELAAAGLNPYPVDVARPTPVGAITQEQWVAGEFVRVAGRFCSIRDHGGVAFGQLCDHAGGLQVLLSADAVQPSLRTFTAAVDPGDLVIVEGTLGQSRTGTASLLATSWQVVAKAIRPIPFAGIKNPEAKLRQRSLDLLTDRAELQFLQQRSAIMTSVREFMTSRNFAEVETPILATTHGGATARPFHTHINAYDTDLYLRIAPELHLKRLIVAGSGPIFEMARNFRNEGADNTHNPEFTAMEAYEPWGDYSSMRRLTEELIRNAAVAVYGKPVLPLGPDLTLTDISQPWAVVDVLTAVSEATGVEVSLDMPFDELLNLAKSYDIEATPSMGPGAVIEELYGELVESSTVLPTFYCDFPAETSPLSAPHRSKPGLAERWDLVVNGVELGTAYSELTDPMVQRSRLTEQSLKAAAGDPEAMEVDEDFLAALELGMPPTGGLGIGMDRLAMLILGCNIRHVLTFPFVRPMKKV